MEMPAVWNTRTRWAVAVISVLAAGCASAPQESPAQRGADEAVAQQVYAALNADPVYFYRHVDVRVDDGVAALSGYVWSSNAIFRARQIARSVPGVATVVTSDLELERAGRSTGRSR